VRARVHRVIHRIAIEAVHERNGAAHVADAHVFAVGNVTGLVVPVVAIATRTEGTHRPDVRRALQPNIRARSIGNGHAEFRDVDPMSNRIHFDLLPLIVIAHAKPTNGLTSSRGSVETDLATVRKRAGLRSRKTCENQRAHARIAAGRARTAGRAHNAAIRRTDFAIAVVTNFARLNNSVTADGKLAVVIASVRRHAVAVVASFTHIDHTVAARRRRVRQCMAIAHAPGTTAATAGTTHAAAGSARRISAGTRIEHAIGLARLHAHIRARARTRLRRIGNTGPATVGVAAARLQSKRGQSEGYARNEQFHEEATHW
jgi:hypothetical protein